MRRPAGLAASIGRRYFAGGLALLPLGASMAFAIAASAVATVGEMLAMPSIGAVVVERSCESSRGAYLGLYTTAFAVAFVVAPLAGTWVYQRLGPSVLWYGCGVVGAALWLGFSFLPLARSGRRSPLGSVPEAEGAPPA